MIGEGCDKVSDASDKQRDVMSMQQDVDRDRTKRLVFVEKR
jgi:hypothetical protein